MRAERRSRGGLGAGLSKAHLAGFGGLSCLLILAVFQAVRETHPDAVADRHHGAMDFISRNAHETNFARHVAHQETRARARAPPAGTDRSSIRSTRRASPTRTSWRARSTARARAFPRLRTNLPARRVPRRTRLITTTPWTPSEPQTRPRRTPRPATIASTSSPRHSNPCPVTRIRACASASPSEYKPNHEYWGSVVLAGDRNLRDSDDVCCRSCAHDPACTVWVYNPSTRECWLKNDENPKPAGARLLTSRGPAACFRP